MKAELTGLPKETSNTDNVDFSEEANFDEAITAEAKASNEMENDPKEELNIKHYKEKMNIDIENSNTGSHREEDEGYASRGRRKNKPRSSAAAGVHRTEGQPAYP